jgi:hypothetical protein
MNKYQIKIKDEQHTILSPKNIEELVYIIGEISKTTEFLMFKCIQEDHPQGYSKEYTIFIKPNEIYYIS